MTENMGTIKVDASDLIDALQKFLRWQDELPEMTARAQQEAFWLHGMKGLLQTAVAAHEFKKGESDGWDSVMLHSTWFETAREVVKEIEDYAAADRAASLAGKE